nr:hypothetical protein [uncultured Nitrososphaera sp.]
MPPQLNIPKYLQSKVGQFHYVYWFRGERKSLVLDRDLFHDGDEGDLWRFCTIEGVTKTKEGAEQNMLTYFSEKYNIPRNDFVIREIDMSDKDCKQANCGNLPKSFV